MNRHFISNTEVLVVYESYFLLPAQVKCVQMISVLDVNYEPHKKSSRK